MAHLRFATVKDLFEAYPTARGDTGVSAEAEASLAFLRRMLNERTPQPGLAYCAYLLPRREAVWWAAQCLRLTETLAAVDTANLAAAEDWVRDPSEAKRQDLVAKSEALNKDRASTWVVLAAAFSGGNFSPTSGVTVPVTGHATAQAVRTGLILGSFQLPAERQTMLQSRWLEGGIKLAGSDSPEALK